MATTRAPLPATHVPLLDANGRVTQAWYDWFRYVDRLNIGQLQGVDLVATPPVNGDVLTYNGTSNRWEPA